MKVKFRQTLISVGLAALAACSVPRPGVSTSTGRIIGADGSTIGAVEIMDAQAGSTLHIKARNLTPGVHGVHLHAVGRCDGKDFANAGPHWNPTNRQHGHDNRSGHHAGDLGNVSVGDDGTLNTLLIATDARLLSKTGDKGLVISDEDGGSLVIHARPDDEKTDPSGNSGERIACAIVAVPHRR